jgi:hypothetical protein
MMKRSEAIEHIVNVLRLTGNHYPEDYDKEGMDAERILDKLEEVGVLPPFNEWSFMMDGDHADQDDVRYYTWEIE